MTQLYTQVSIHKLKEVHALTHPGARLAPALRTERSELESAPSLAAALGRDAVDEAVRLDAALLAEAEHESDMEERV